MKQVHDAARRNPGKRIVMLVGVEHGYWLRERLRADSTVEFLEFDAAYAARSK